MEANAKLIRPGAQYGSNMWPDDWDQKVGPKRIFEHGSTPASHCGENSWPEIASWIDCVAAVESISNSDCGNRHSDGERHKILRHFRILLIDDGQHTERQNCGAQYLVSIASTGTHKRLRISRPNSSSGKFSVDIPGTVVICFQSIVINRIKQCGAKKSAKILSHHINGKFSTISYDPSRKTPKTSQG